VKLVANRVAASWRTQILDDDVVLFTSTPSPRLGCSIRNALIWLQNNYGHPAGGTFEINLEEW